MIQKKEKLFSKTKENGFWDDNKRAASINKQISNIDKTLDKFDDIKKEYSSAKEVYDLLKTEFDKSMYKEWVSLIENLSKKVSDMYIETLLNGKYDDNDAIVEIHAGAGGTEAQDWAEMLFRMYDRFAESQEYKLSVLDKLEGDSAGVKSISFKISGFKAYGYLKAEKGVHRLVRISPFDSNSRRHTSFSSVQITPEIDVDDDIQISPDELRIDTYRASGAGGQHVNTTDSAVRITHTPSGIVVQCQNERSQTQNKETALKMLKSKLVEIKERKQLEEVEQIKGDDAKNEWGSQIRSYIFHPYNLVKDHRTNHETSNVQAVMDGDIKKFIVEYLKSDKN